MWPFAVTLAVTLLRLCGELQGWSPRWFGKVAFWLPITMLAGGLFGLVAVRPAGE